MLEFNKPIKVLCHCDYGLYGCDIPKYVYDYVKEFHQDSLEELFMIDYGNIYLKDTSDKSRCNPVLIEAFENLSKAIEEDEDGKFDGLRVKYKIEELYLELEYDYYDGKESNIRIIGR